MTTTAAPAKDIFSAWDQFDTDAPFVAALEVEAPVVTARCTRCGRTLRSATSIAAGMGRTCARKVAAAVKEAAKTVPTAGSVRHLIANLYEATSRTDGITTYHVNTVAGSCTCMAGRYGRPCWHKTEAAAMAAA